MATTPLVPARSSSVSAAHRAPLVPAHPEKPSRGVSGAKDVSQNSVLPEVLMDERGHLLERPLGNRRGEILEKTFALALEDRDLDLAAGLTILPDELVEIRAGVRLLVAARDAQHGGRGCPLAMGQDARGRSLGHSFFRL